MTKSIREENIETLTHALNEVRQLSEDDALALQVYMHAIVHRQDSTAVAAGLLAARWLDKTRGVERPALLNPPMDCLIATMVVKHGFEALVGKTSAEIAALVDELTTASLSEVYEKAERLLGEDMQEQAMDAAMQAFVNSPSDVTH